MLEFVVIFCGQFSCGQWVICGANFLCQIYWTSITYHSVHPFIATLTLSNSKGNRVYFENAYIVSQVWSQDKKIPLLLHLCGFW